MRGCLSIVMGVVCMVCMLGSVSAATFPAFHYSGMLTTTQGNPLNGEFSVYFSLYDAAVGGEQIWTERKRVTIDNGEFAVELTPDIRFDQEYWLALQVGSDQEMMPRQKMGAVPYAEAAKQLFADTLSLSSTEIKKPTLSLSRASTDTRDYDPVLEVENTGCGRGVSITNYEEHADPVLDLTMKKYSCASVCNMTSLSAGREQNYGSVLNVVGDTILPVQRMYQGGSGVGLSVIRSSDNPYCNTVEVTTQNKGDGVHIFQRQNAYEGLDILHYPASYAAIRVDTRFTPRPNGAKLVDIDRLFQVINSSKVYGGVIFKFGRHYMWIDAQGDMRVSGGQPSHDLDGERVGSQE